MPLRRLDSRRAQREIGATARLAVPLILAQLAAIGSNVVDTVLAGHVSAHVLGAVALGTNIWILAVVSGTGLMMAVPPVVAQLDGAARRTEVGAIFRQALWLALFSGLGLWFGMRHAGMLLELIGVTPRLRADVQAFLQAISWGAPALTGFFALRGLSEGLSMTRPSMYFSWGGLLLLVPLDCLFMFGWFGLPPQGARGCGIATASVLWLQWIGFAMYVGGRRHYRGLGLFERFDYPSWRSFVQLLQIGLPMTVSLLAEAGLFVTAALLISRLGEVVMAGHQVAINAASFFFMVPLGLAMAITVRVGHAAGRRDAVGVRYAGLCGIGLTLVTQLVSASLMLSFPELIAAVYTHDVVVITLAAQLLMLAGLFQFSDGIQVASNGALRGLKDTKLPMAITLFAYWIVGMPVGWWLAFPQGLGARGMWMGMIAGLSMAAAMLLARFWQLSARPFSTE